MSRMDTNKEKILYKDLSYKITGLAMEVHSKLGYGFLEKVYENAMMVLFESNGLAIGNSFKFRKRKAQIREISSLKLILSYSCKFV